jgi:hypothetical protein
MKYYLLFIRKASFTVYASFKPQIPKLQTLN